MCSGEVGMGMGMSISQLVRGEKKKGGGRRLTLSTMSSMDSSVDEASFRIARNAAIRTLSPALDHSSRHVYPVNEYQQQDEQNEKKNPGETGTAKKTNNTHTPLQVPPNSLPTANNIWHDMRALREGEDDHLRLAELGEDVEVGQDELLERFLGAGFASWCVGS